MAHDIEIINGVASMAYAADRGLPWHGLGQAADSAMTAEEALRLSNLDWTVLQLPLFAKREDTVGGENLATYLGCEGFVANVRDFDHKTLGVVTERYKPLQNREAFAFLDELVGGGARFETAMSLNGGKRVNMSVRLAQETVIAGDTIAQYVTVVNGHDGKTGVLVFPTPVRVVCANTENLAISGAPRMWKAKHMGDVHSKVAEARRTVEMMEVYMTALQGKAEEMLKVSFSMDDWAKMCDTLVPEPESNKDFIVKRADEKRGDLFNRIFAEDIENFRWTGWGAVQAVSDHVTHERLGRVSDEVRFERILEGHPMLDKATEYILALA